MNKVLKTFLGLIVVCIYLNADNRIVFYLNKAPQAAFDLAKRDLERENDIKKIEKMNKKLPSELSHKVVRGEIEKYLMPGISGFMALYSGYVDYSNKDGLISFPLRHTSPRLYLVVTPDIKLVKVKGNTISYLELKKGIPAKIYLFEKREDKNKQYFWHASEQKIPANRHINNLSVVLLTKPKNVYVALGDFLSNNSKHIVLPNDIYVVGVGGNNKILLESLNIKRYFEPVEFEEQKVSNVLSKKMIINN
jgi:hypothetical protein